MKSFWMRLWEGLNVINPYQFVIYFGLFGWGIYSLVRPEPTVSSMLPRGVYLVWLGLHIVAPLVVFSGKWLNRGSPSSQRILLGWELQWVGDTAVCFIAAMTAYAFAQPVWPGSLFLVTSFVFTTMLMTMITLRDGIATVYYWRIRRRIGDPD